MFQLNPTLLNTASLNLEVVGNNITNSGVTGYKSSDFESALAGAVRSSQGAQVKGAKLNLSQGSIVASVSPLSMAINGAGFFKVEKIDGSYAYTRDGSFQLDKEGYIINSNGDKLIGFPDATTNAQGVLQIDTAKNPPEATSLAQFEMNLPAEEVEIDVDTAFLPSDSSTFNNTTSTIVYDNLGVAKVIQSYYRYTPTHWEAYIYSNSEEIAKLNFVFAPGGTLDKDLTVVETSSEAGAATWTAATGRLAFNVPAGTGEVLENLIFDFSDITRYAGDFTASASQIGGYPPGALLGVSVERDGKILARYGNGQQQIQAQVMLANFKNPNGLEVARDNQFLPTVASGVEDAGAPGQYGTGAIEGSSVEQSNVDLTAEMIKLIAAQRNYQSVAQLIKKQDEVLQTAINIGQ
jgi:flagellar hook protein FlgE